MTPLNRESDWPCARADGNGTLLDVHVVPGARRTEACGLHGEALKLRLAAPPVEGQANECLLRWLAEQLQLPRQQVQLKRGATSRRKQVLLAKTLADVGRWLDSLPAASPSR